MSRRNWGIKQRVLFLTIFPTIVISLFLGIYFINIRINELHDRTIDRGTAIVSQLASLGQNGVFKFTALWAQGDYWLDIDNITILPNEVTTSTTEVLTNISDFRLFPNPSSGLIQLELSLVEREPIFLQILDRTGQIVFEERYSNRNHVNQFIDLSNFSIPH